MSRLLWFLASAIAVNILLDSVDRLLSGHWFAGVTGILLSLTPFVLALGAFRDGQKYMADYVISRLEPKKPPTG